MIQLLSSDLCSSTTPWKVLTNMSALRILNSWKINFSVARGLCNLRLSPMFYFFTRVLSKRYLNNSWQKAKGWWRFRNNIKSRKSVKESCDLSSAKVYLNVQSCCLFRIKLKMRVRDKVLEICLRNSRFQWRECAFYKSQSSKL